MTLTKADIGQKIAENCGFMKGEAYEIIDRLLDIIRGKLISGGAATFCQESCGTRKFLVPDLRGA